MSYTTEISTKWFPKLGDALPGLETAVRGDGSYDGEYRLIRSVWLIERNGERERLSSFDDFWRTLNPTSDDIQAALDHPEGELLHLIHRGLDCGRPVSRHPLWDHMDDVAPYRDQTFEDGILSFFAYERSDIFEYPPWRRIEKIRFKITDGTFSREHITELDPTQ